MAGFQQLRVTREVNFTGAVLKGVGTPLTKGKILYVDSRSWGVGDSGYEGTDPNYPLNSITNAMAKCTAGNGDYIFVLDGYDNDAATITVAKTNLHFIGLGSKSHAAPFAWLKIAGTGAAAVFTLKGGDAANAEIAGFTLGADSAHACITSSAGTSTNLPYAWIHDCAFAASGDVAFIAQDGILCGTGAGLDGCLIEECKFGMQLTRDGIRFINFYDGLIRNNIFKMAAYMGIRQLTGGAATGTPDIIGNRFGQKMPALDKGSAIYITDSGGGLITDNVAAENGDGTCDNNPYVDLSTGSADTTKNAWGVNWVGYAVGAPAVT